MSAKNNQKENNRELRFLRRALLIALLMIGFLGFSIYRMPNQFVIYTAPDVSKSFVQRVGEVPNTAIYGFVRTLWESLNYCQNDCAEDYPTQLKNYLPYLTDACYLELKDHFDMNSQLFNFRRRMLLPTENSMFSEDKIRRISSDTWYVKTEYIVRDDVQNVEIRNNLTIYPIKVIRSLKPLSVNPIGLEVDCFFGEGPMVLKQSKENKQ